MAMLSLKAATSAAKEALLTSPVSVTALLVLGASFRTFEWLVQ
jgi:hypothetical protein